MMHMTRKIPMVLVICALIAASTARADLAAVQKGVKEKISQIDAIVTRLEVQLGKAESANDLTQVNCILSKVNLVKGLLKASQRSALVLTKAYIDQNDKMTGVYQKRVQDYRDNAVELEAAMNECLGVAPLDRRSTLVLIRPEGGQELGYADTSPWAWDYVEGAESIPAIPAASPYR